MANKCMRYFSAALLAFAVLAWATGSAGQSTGRTRTFKIGKGGTLIVQIEGVGADILVSTWEKGEIELRIDGLSDEDLKDLETREDGNTVHVELYLDGGWGKSRSARFSFTVPSEINLDLGTSGGDITVANLINEIEGVAALAARVSNPEPLGGGGDKEVRAVDAADREAANELIKPKLREAALKQLEAQLGPGEFIIPESLGGTILESTFDREVTEQADEHTLLMRVAYTAQKVKSEDANSLVFGALQAQTPPDYELIPEGMTFQRGEVTGVPETEDLYQFPMQGTGFAAASLEVGKAVSEIAGKPIDEARDLLQEALRLKKTPQITIFPQWFPTLPWLTFRIQTSVDPQG